MTDGTLNDYARNEAALRELTLIMSRFAADLMPAFTALARALLDARPEIGRAVYVRRKGLEMTREQYARLHNVPLATLIRVERWRNLEGKNP